MRTIKFRAWDKENNQIVQVGEVGFGAQEPLSIRDYQFPATKIHQFELMQFTGLLDKNGKEIYEGDIVVPYRKGRANSDWYPQMSRKQIVEWINSKHWTGFNLSGQNESWIWEVIGNIWEN